MRASRARSGMTSRTSPSRAAGPSRSSAAQGLARTIQLVVGINAASTATRTAIATTKPRQSSSRASATTPMTASTAYAGNR